jgi:phospholipid/cholesterol/gamma-HCH transport system substrate-binding protein
MGRQAPRPAAIATALLFALSVFAFTLFVWRSFGGSVPLEAKGYRVHVLFGSDASNLVSGSEARISGVEVGRVTRVRRVAGRTDAEIELERRYAPLSSTSRAIVRSKTLLGETFVELSPGSASARPLPDGGTLARRQVAQAQGLDQVLGAFDAPTRAALKQFLRGLSTSLHGRGQDLNAALGNAAPTLDELQRLAAILDHQRPALARLIDRGGDALQAVGDREAAVRELVRAGDDVLGATAARDRDLTDTVRELPAFLAQLRATLDEAEGAAGDAGPTLRALRPVAPLLRPALDETAGVVRELVPLSRDLGPVIDQARRGLPAATRVVNTARPLVRRLHPAGRELVPTLQVIEAYRNDIVATLANVGSSTNDTLPVPGGEPQHYLRLLPPVFSDALVGYARRQRSGRANAYPAPGAQSALAGGSPKAFSCANVRNAQATPPLGGSPPCVEQGPWSLNGISRAFPRVERAAP